MPQLTPQQQAENIVAGIQNTYQVVAKRHVHPWYSYALFATAIGFGAGSMYVANQHAQFSASQAATVPVEFHLGQVARPDMISEPRKESFTEIIKNFQLKNELRSATIEPVIRTKLGGGNYGITFGQPQTFSLQRQADWDIFNKKIAAILKSSDPGEITLIPKTGVKESYLVAGSGLAKNWFSTNFFNTGAGGKTTNTENGCRCKFDLSFTVECSAKGEKGTTLKAILPSDHAEGGQLTITKEIPKFVVPYCDFAGNQCTDYCNAVTVVVSDEEAKKSANEISNGSYDDAACTAQGTTKKLVSATCNH